MTPTLLTDSICKTWGWGGKCDRRNHKVEIQNSCEMVAEGSHAIDTLLKYLEVQGYMKISLRAGCILH